MRVRGSAHAPSTTTSSSAPARPGACSPTVSRPIGARACCCWRRAGRTTGSGFTSRSATSSPSTTRAADWCYRTEPEPALGGRSIPYPRGKVVGGSSAINGMIYMRGAGRRLRSMAPAGPRRLGLGRRAALLQGARGLLRRRRRRARRGRRAARRSAEGRLAGARRGAARRHRGRHPGRPTDFNRGDNEGVGPLHVNQRRGVRFQAAKAFLRPALIAAQPDAGDRRAGGAHPARGPPRRRRRVSPRAGARRPMRGREVILAAGVDRLAAAPHAVGHRPRRAPRRSTASRCRPIVPGVGSNLHDHLQIPLRFTVEGHRHPQRALPFAAAPGTDGCRVRALAARAADHGAVAARHLHPLLARRRARRHRLQRGALHAHQHRHADARQAARRDADRLRLPADQPRRHPPEVGRSGGGPGDPAQLPGDRARPARRRRAASG